MSTGLPPVFFDSCLTPRPMNWASPRFQLVTAGLPSTASERFAAPSAITTWSYSCVVPAASAKSAPAVALNATARGLSASTVDWMPGREVGSVALPGAAVLNSTRTPSTAVVPTLAGEWVPAGV
jgi:hypothetical protein